MCGLFGWVGKHPKTFDKAKFDILGILNEARGKHSCGMSIDNEIVIGVDKNKLFRDWLASVNYSPPEKIPVVLGHTRQATYGAHTIDNAHPFGFPNDKEEYDFIGVHNGSLLNHTDLAENRDIPVKVKKGKGERVKIDSEILLECLFKDKNFKVLSQYDGAAALLFYNTKE